LDLLPAVERKLKEISSEPCPAGGGHEPAVQKTEECPDGTTRQIISCRKCKAYFELEL
jgi:hypothetical protein